MKLTTRKLIVFVINVCLLVGLLSPVAAASSEEGAQILTQQLTLRDDLTMRFDVSVDTEYLQTASICATWGDERRIYDVAELTANENGSYPICVDLAAAQMTEEISLTVSTADAVLTQGSYSIREYARVFLEGSYTEATKQMVRQMLDYGSKAQTYFAYNTQSLANEGYEIENSVLLPEEPEPLTVDGKVTGVDFYGAALVFHSKLAVRYYFKAPGGLRDITFSVAGEEYEPVSSGQMYYIEVGGINPQELDQIKTVSVTDITDTMSVHYSPLHYIVRMCQKNETSQSLKELLQALYAYHLEAKAFAGIREDLSVSIAGHSLTGQWLLDRVGNLSIGPEKSYDADTDTKWNPQANVGYTDQPGIIYELDGFYDLMTVQCLFHAPNTYFTVYGSPDGVDYRQIGGVTAQNAATSYDGNSCTVTVTDAQAVKYVKIVFNGRGDNSNYVNFYEIGITGKKTVFSQASITAHSLQGAWVLNREGDPAIGPQMSYDGDPATKWNPQASGNYSQEQGIVYTLDGWYDLAQVHCTFSAADMYFEVYGSTDGAAFTPIGAITSENSSAMYNGSVCTLDAFSAKTVKYIKIMVTGRQIANDYVNLFEVSVTGEKVAPSAVEASIVNGQLVGNWSVAGDAQLSYDADPSTVWQPQATDYQSGESILYTLDGAYELTSLQLFFGNRQYYFKFYTSADGVNFTLAAEVTAENASKYYSGDICTLDGLNTSCVRYIKLLFTGSADSSYISLWDQQSQAAQRTENSEKQVGIFYFLWHGAKTAAGPFDVTKVMQTDPNAALSDNAWLLAGGGAVGTPHWWGESLFGYYRALDRWVVERDVQMLTDAGVDYLALDYSNGTAYPEQVLNMLQILDKYYDQGYDVPQLTFVTKADSGAMVMELYEDFYLKYPEYAHLWYCWDGKPLMVGVESSASLSEACREYFTWRHPQWPREGYNENAFPWMDFDPDGDGVQTVYEWDDGSTVMSVSVAQHSGTLAFSSSALYGDTTNHTRSWHNGANDTADDAYLYGYNFAEQFENAIARDVDMVFITGWNEWIATRQASGSWNDINGDPITDPVILVDNCNINNSRDIQPMKGGYGDNYYMQMIDYVRRYKGLEQSTSLSSWQEDIVTAYQDYTGEIEDRNFKGYGTLYYSDTTGRNDFAQLKMVHDEQFLYAYARTVDDIIGMGQAQCMTLFLNTGSSTNWCGYDYVVGRTAATDGTVSVEKRTENGWQTIGTADYILKGNQLQIMIPLSLLDLENRDIDLEFKWADNYQTEDVYSFYLSGDAAPYGRQNYRYIAKAAIFDPLQIRLQEVKAFGVCRSDDRAEVTAVITGSQVSGDWNITREGVYGCGPELSYDGSVDTKWNPQAKDYKNLESITYTLDQAYDLTGLRMQFSARQQYLKISVSSDGEAYTVIEQVTADGDAYGSSYVCTLSELIAWNVKYIKLEFTGSSDNGLWVNFYEITVTGKKCEG